MATPENDDEYRDLLAALYRERFGPKAVPPPVCDCGHTMAVHDLDGCSADECTCRRVTRTRW